MSIELTPLPPLLRFDGMSRLPSFSRILFVFLVGAVISPQVQGAPRRVFNVRDYGATGQKVDDARPAIQKAIDACAAAAGGTVVLPSGQYRAGTLHLRSHVSVQLDFGAILYASPDTNAYDCGTNFARATLFSGENLEDVSLSGQGILDGQAEYEWRPDDFERNYDHKIMMQKLGKSIMRTFPAGHPKREIYPHLLWLSRCKNARVTGLNFLHSPNWTITLYGCDHATFDGLYVYSSLKEAVWADGIDLDGCKNVSIANCNIETGDDCVALISEDWFGPPLVCENVVVTNCRLSTASAGVKFSEGNIAGVRNIRVVNTLFNNVNRGFAFQSTRGGTLSDVFLSDLVINCNRFEWFWAGDAQPFRFRVTRQSELDGDPRKAGEPDPGLIRNITIRNVVAHAKGSSLFYGHPEKWLDGITLENVKLYLSADPAAPYDTAQHALDFRRARNVKLRGVQVFWEKPVLDTWKSALNFENATGVDVDNFAAGNAPLPSPAPVVMLNQVRDASIRNCRALDGTDVFLKIAGAGTRGIQLKNNDFSKAKVGCQLGNDLAPGAVEGEPLRGVKR